MYGTTCTAFFNIFSSPEVPSKVINLEPLITRTRDPVVPQMAPRAQCRTAKGAQAEWPECPSAPKDQLWLDHPRALGQGDDRPVVLGRDGDHLLRR